MGGYISHSLLCQSDNITPCPDSATGYRAENNQQAATAGPHQHHQSPDQEALEWATGREREGGVGGPIVGKREDHRSSGDSDLTFFFLS